jgi:hypothetical protein
VNLAGVISIYAGEVITGTAGAGRTIPALPRNALVELQMTVEVLASPWPNILSVPNPHIPDGIER